MRADRNVRRLAREPLRHPAEPGQAQVPLEDGLPQVRLEEKDPVGVGPGQGRGQAEGDRGLPLAGHGAHDPDGGEAVGGEGRDLGRQDPVLLGQAVVRPQDRPLQSRARRRSGAPPRRSGPRSGRSPARVLRAGADGRAPSAVVASARPSPGGEAGWRRRRAPPGSRPGVGRPSASRTASLPPPGYESTERRSSTSLIVGSRKSTTIARPHPEEQPAQRSPEREEPVVREARALRHVGGVDDPELLALRVLLQLGRHLGVELLREKGCVVLAELLVVAGEAPGSPARAAARPRPGPGSWRSSAPPRRGAPAAAPPRCGPSRSGPAR